VLPRARDRAPLLTPRSGTPLKKPTWPVLVGGPRTWFESGEINSHEGHLYVATLWENRDPEEVRLVVQYTTYLPDGTALPGCSLGGSADILPGERAWLSCSPIILPRDAGPFHVTPRVVSVVRLGAAEAPVVVDSASMNLDSERSQLLTSRRLSDRIPFQPVAWVRALGSDQDVVVVFRFYDASGAQLATCESWSAVVQPEVARRIEGRACPSLSALPEKPVRMQTRVLSN
jgi:hypothetical protein